MRTNTTIGAHASGSSDSWGARLREALADRIAPRRHAIAEAIATEAHRSIPEYGGLRGVAARRLAGEISNRLDLVLSVLRERRSLSGAERDAIRAAGVDQAARDVPINASTQLVAVARHVLWRVMGKEVDAVVARELVGIPRPALAAVTFDLLADLQAALDDIRDELTTGYAHGLETRRIRSRFYAEVFGGGADEDEDAIEDRGERAGHEREQRYGLLLVAPTHSSRPSRNQLRSALADLARALPGSFEALQVSDPPSHAIVMVPQDASAEWRPVLRVVRRHATREHMVVVAGAPVEGILALRRRYAEARADLRLALAVESQGGVVEHADLVIERLLAECGEEIQREMLEPLRPLLESDLSAQLLHTIGAMERSSGVMRIAAAELRLHANTLRSRVDLIERTTGLHLREPRDRRRLEVATHLWRLRLGGITTTWAAAQLSQRAGHFAQ